MKPLFNTQDPQFKAIQQISSLNLPQSTKAFAVVGGWIVSYQLWATGEKRWQEFADLVQKHQDLLREPDWQKFWQTIFDLTQTNKRLKNHKLKRLDKLAKFWPQFEKNYEFYAARPSDLLKDLAWWMNQPHNAKTIVFAYKVFVWYLASEGKNVVYDVEANLPWDSRWQKLEKSLNLPSGKLKKFILNQATKHKISPLYFDDWIWWRLGKDLPSSFEEFKSELQAIIKHFLQ